MSRLARALSAVVLAGGVMLAPVAPSLASGGPPDGGGGFDPHAHPGAVRAQITFEKNHAHPWRSRIVWDAAVQQRDGTWKPVAHTSWRAGSGMPGRHTENACVRNHGWLPDGTYRLRQLDDYPGTLIHGRVFRLSDKRCADGTLRTELFIHTETGPGNVPCPDRPGDQPCRWEYPRINDYTSHGCIKMSPASILALTRAYHRFFRAGVRYPVARVRLVVR